jgi:hypothetical protein
MGEKTACQSINGTPTMLRTVPGAYYIIGPIFAARNRPECGIFRLPASLAEKDESTGNGGCMVFRVCQGREELRALSLER